MTAAPDVDDEGDIVVTARRVSELLSDVPASITAFTAQTIERANIQTAEDMVQLTPGVTIVTSTAEAGDTQINIRGINGARDAESSVALVVDGILKTNTAALNQNQGTLRQIEVLRGPQGALYGRNAAAGAIVIQTLRPTETFTGAVEASYANVNTASLNGHVSGPIADGVGFVLSGDYRTTNGFYRNLFLDRRVVDDQEAWNIDGRIVAALGPATTLDAKVRYGELRGASINFNSSFHIPALGGAFYEDVNDHPFRYYSNIRPTNDQTTFEASLRIDHDFGPVTLSAWTLYSNIRNDLVADGTSADFARYIFAAQPAGQPAVNACFTSTAALTGFPVNPPGFIGQIPVPFIFAPANGSVFGAYSPTTCDGTQYQRRNQEDISAEVRLISNGNGPLDWQLGAYYLNIDRTVGVSLGADTGQGAIEELYNPPTSGNPTSQLFADQFRTNVYAVFGSLEWEITDAIDLGLALRYDIERRRVRSLVPTATDPFTGGPINPGQAFGPIAPQRATFSQLQPRISLRWEVAPRTNIYANWGIGFKSGGFNNQGSAAIVDQNFNNPVIPGIDADVTIEDQFDRERSSAFEVGIRGRVGPINYSLAGYYTRITDMQFFEFFVGGFGLLRVVSNIDRVDIRGAELSLNAEPVDGWTIFGSFNLTDSEIKRNSSRTYTVGNSSPYTADYTINLGTQIEAPISDALNLVFRANYRMTGPTWFHTVQNQTRPTLFSGLLPISALALPSSVGDARYDVNRREAYGVLDLRFGIEAGRWRATIFANNFLDERYLNEVIPAIEFGGSFISPGARRLYGVEVGFRF
ncbi:MAG: TonB-dependent receptor [Sphingosinicella sp.]|uniref:TonB-dependent receptor n=1 Tax=Sphingosinicella sp. TaxID=1917971 RepID=UPI0040380C00